MNYNEFIKSKRHSEINYGVEPVFMPELMFDYQKYVAEYAIRKGRCAVFLDTGLGKTIIELTTAINYIRITNKPVLILTPLAVAFQFIKEAEKFKIDDISYSKDGNFKTKLVVCNYERLDKFNPNDFDCVILDESSILKNFDGALKQKITSFIKRVKYRFLFTATPSPNDFSNCETKEQFLEQYDFLVNDIARVTKPGRITAVHIADIITKDGSLWDLPHEVIKLHEKHGFAYKNRITVWKETLKVRMRTMVRSLMHKLIVEDSTECFTAMPDYVMIFKRKGDNEIPVTHTMGLSHYAGARPILPEMADKYGTFEQLKEKYKNHTDPKTNKLSHIIWQRYASCVWDDIRIDNVLKYKEGKDEDDEKHVHPLQLDVIDRLVELYSNPGEVVLTPFMGVGSEVFSPVSMGRKAIGIELKESYFRQAVKNMAEVGYRFQNEESAQLFENYN